MMIDAKMLGGVDSVALVLVVMRKPKVCELSQNPSGDSFEYEQLTRM